MTDFKPRFLKPSETSSFLDRNDSSLSDTTDFVYNRHLSQSIQTQRQKLPIFNNRNHILYLLEKYQTLVLVGETGCGKSTQVPQNYPIDRGFDDNTTQKNYKDVTWVGCEINPLCDVTVKAVLLDHTNYYLFAPLVTIIDNILEISQISYITPNFISVFHVFVAILSAKCISSDSLAYRRLGVVLFEVRTFLDDLDGHVARVRKHVKGERSEIGTTGYYVDGICDAFGTTALLIGAFIFLKNNPPRRGYMQLPTCSDSKETNIIYKSKITSKKVSKKLFCFAAQLILSSMAWNRYIALYQEMLKRNDISPTELFRSDFFFLITWLWRVVNVHNMLHCFLLGIFCDKLWEFLRSVQLIGFVILLFVIGITEVHVREVSKIFGTHIEVTDSSRI